MIRTTIEAFEIDPAPPIDDTLRGPCVLLEITVLLNNESGCSASAKAVSNLHADGQFGCKHA